MDSAPVADLTDLPEPGLPTAEAPAARCPFPHHLLPGGTSAGEADDTRTAWCPVPAPSPEVAATAAARRTPADLFVRRLLRITDRPVGVTQAAAYSAFQKSMLISAVRCTLTYVIFPFVLPMFSFVRGVGPVVGILIGSFAIVCDVFTVRRFFAVDHKWRWQFSAIAVSIIGLLAVLLVQDISHVVSRLA